jgi:hypothetical protein
MKRGSLPVGAGEQVPTEPALLQIMQALSHCMSQQTPS